MVVLPASNTDSASSRCKPTICCALKRADINATLCRKEQKPSQYSGPAIARQTVILIGLSVIGFALGFGQTVTKVPESRPKVTLGARSHGTPNEKNLPSGYAINLPIIADEGCIKDVLRATQATGIERRKLTAELFNYRCIEKLKGIYWGVVTDTKLVATGPNKKTRVYKALFVYDVEMTKSALGKDPDLDSIELTKSGWILDNNLPLITKTQMETILRGK